MIINPQVKDEFDKSLPGSICGPAQYADSERRSPQELLMALSAEREATIRVNPFSSFHLIRIYNR
ncbi:MAG: hypothetical protein R2727_11955 [Bacteroidales bacterium]